MNITSYADSWLRLMQMGFEGNLAGQDLLNFEISIGAIISRDMATAMSMPMFETESLFS